MFLKKKIKRGYLDSLGERNDIKIVGVMGCYKGVGVTTISIAMANYLAEIMSAKTAILECNESGDFCSMGQLYIDANDIKSSYSIGKVTYFFEVSFDEFIATHAKRFEYVIVDMGCCLKNDMDLLYRLDYKILLGSIMPYKLSDQKLVMDELRSARILDSCLCLLNGDEKNVKEYSLKNKINSLQAPMIANPYIIENKLVNFFQLLF